jgi:hypothetical protein
MALIRGCHFRSGQGTRPRPSGARLGGRAGRFRATSSDATSASTGPCPRISSASPRCAGVSTSSSFPNQLTSGAHVVKRTTDGSPSPSIRPCGVSTATTLPLSTTATRSQRCSTSSMKCVASTTVVPARRMSWISAHVARRRHTVSQRLDQVARSGMFLGVCSTASIPAQPPAENPAWRWHQMSLRRASCRARSPGATRWLRVATSAELRA